MEYNAHRQQPITMKVGPNGSGSIINYTYEYYDANGQNNNRIRQVTDHLSHPSFTTSYTYDAYNRLTHATAGAYWRTYSYSGFSMGVQG